MGWEYNLELIHARGYSLCFIGQSFHPLLQLLYYRKSNELLDVLCPSKSMKF